MQTSHILLDLNFSEYFFCIVHCMPMPTVNLWFSYILISEKILKFIDFFCAYKQRIKTATRSQDPNPEEKKKKKKQFFPLLHLVAKWHETHFFVVVFTEYNNIQHVITWCFYKSKFSSISTCLTIVAWRAPVNPIVFVGK